MALNADSTTAAAAAFATARASFRRTTKARPSARQPGLDQRSRGHGLFIDPVSTEACEFPAQYLGLSGLSHRYSPAHQWVPALLDRQPAAIPLTSKLEIERATALAGDEADAVDRIMHVGRPGAAVAAAAPKPKYHSGAGATVAPATPLRPPGRRRAG